MHWKGSGINFVLISATINNFMDYKTDHSKGENFEMLAKTLFGFEDILSKEIESLGGKILTKENRAVRFTGDKKILYKVNYHVRTALGCSDLYSYLMQRMKRNFTKIYWNIHGIKFLV